METDTARRERQAQEHHDRMAKLAQELGFDKLRALVPVSIDRVRDALRKGDEHLNTIGLHLWDRAAVRSSTFEPPTARTGFYPSLGIGFLQGKDEPYATLRASARGEPWCAKPGLSLSERVCVLKHVAREAARAQD